MGLMGQDACGICQGDHHYTDHPDWREIFSGQKLWLGFSGGAGGSSTVMNWTPVEYAAFEREFEMRLQQSFGVPMVDVTAIGDRERRYIPGGPVQDPVYVPARTARYQLTDGRVVEAALSHNEGICCACGEIWNIRGPAHICKPRTDCIDCHLEDVLDKDGRCRFCAELRELPARPKPPALKHDWRGRGVYLSRCRHCGEVRSVRDITPESPCPGRMRTRSALRCFAYGMAAGLAAFVVMVTVALILAIV